MMGQMIDEEINGGNGQLFETLKCSVISNEKRMTFESQTPFYKRGKTSFMMLC